jgi:predicted metal-dependent hydrolase
VSGDKDVVLLKRPYIWVHSTTGKDAAKVKSLLDEWYTGRAIDWFERSLIKNAAKLGRRLKQLPKMRVHSMPKRWGSWALRSGILLNPELIKFPGSCIDYVVTHELCHAIHGNHGREFYELLHRLMPDWERRKARLEQMAAESGSGTLD